MTISDVVESEIPCADVAVLCGPSHAEEVGRLIPPTVVAGARTQKTAELLQDLFMNEVFRVYTSPDAVSYTHLVRWLSPVCRIRPLLSRLFSFMVSAPFLVGKSLDMTCVCLLYTSDGRINRVNKGKRCTSSYIGKENK